MRGANLQDGMEVIQLPLHHPFFLCQLLGMLLAVVGKDSFHISRYIIGQWTNLNLESDVGFN